MRESVGFDGPWLVFAPFVCGWKLGRKELLQVALSCAIFFLFAFGGFAYWFLSSQDYCSAWTVWRETMSNEVADHPGTIRIVGPFLLILFFTFTLILLYLAFA